MERPSIAIVVLAFGILALIFLVSGFATRGWIIYEMTVESTPADVHNLDWEQANGFVLRLKIKVKFGLWKGEVCVMSKCSELSFTESSGVTFYDKVAHAFPWTRYKVIGTFALILGILSFFFTLAHVRTNNCPSGVVTLITWTTTGVLFFYLVGKFAKVTENMNEEFSLYHSEYATADIDAKSPYSVVLVGLGCLACFIAAFFALVNITCCGQGKGAGRALRYGQAAAALTAVTTTTSTSSTARF